MDSAAGDGAASPPTGEATGAEIGKSVFTLLREAFALYRLHAKALLATCAILFVPASIGKSFALKAILAPTMVASDYMRQTAALGEKATEASRRALADGVRDGKLDPRVVDEFTRQSARNLEELGRSNAVASGAVPSRFRVWLLEFAASLVQAFAFFGLMVPLAGGALTVSVADRILGGDTSWRQIWMALLRRLGRLLSALLPAGLLVALGFAVLKPLGVVAASAFAFIAPVVLIEGLGGREAIRRSVELARRDWPRVAVVLIVFGLLRWLADGAASVFIPQRALFFRSLFADLFTMVLMPIPIMGAVLLYFDLRRTRDGFTQDRLRADLAALRATPAS